MREALAVDKGGDSEDMMGTPLTRPTIAPSPLDKFALQRVSRGRLEIRMESLVMEQGVGDR